MTGPATAVGEWPVPDTRSAVTGRVGEGPLGSVGIDPRNDVEGAGPERPRDMFVSAHEALDEMLQNAARSHRRGEFD